MSMTIKATNLPDRNYDDPEVSRYMDKRETMPKGGYRFGTSNAALRPDVPKGQ